jgi:GT2 family glycosyltransferase
LRPRDQLWVRDNTDDNIGFAAAANELAGRGSQPLICFVNPDGDLTPMCLDELDRAFDDPAIVGADANLGPAWNRPLLDDGTPDFLSGACLAVRRTAFEAIGGFDERLFMYGEDVDLSYKLKRLGRIVFVPGARFDHDQGTDRPFASLHRAYRNWLVVMRRHREADVEQMLRDASYSLRRRHYKEGLARFTGVGDYLIRARRWA